MLILDKFFETSNFRDFRVLELSRIHSAMKMRKNLCKLSQISGLSDEAFIDFWFNEVINY